MAKNNLVKGLLIIITIPNDFYEDYMINKAIRKLFYKWIEHAKGILELIHMDIFSLVRTITNEGNRYFISFIDDYTYKVYIYFLSTKENILKKFKEFKAMTEN